MLATCATASYLYPGETVPSDTMRIIALGTGTPTTYRNQAATSYLLQLGSEANLLFDIGSGSITNLYATQVDLSTVDKVCSSHLPLT